MNRYHKIFFSVVTLILLAVVASLIYGRTVSDDTDWIKERLQTVTSDSLNQIIIAPENPDWPINLTLDTIRISDKQGLSRLTQILNGISEKYRGKGQRKTWEAKVVLDYKNNQDITLIVVDSFKGVCVFLTNTMGNPKYKCDGLRTPFEELANYSENVGKRK
jgi:hypothetical protein